MGGVSCAKKDERAEGLQNSLGGFSFDHGIGEDGSLQRCGQRLSHGNRPNAALSRGGHLCSHYGSGCEFQAGVRRWLSGRLLGSGPLGEITLREEPLWNILRLFERHERQPRRQRQPRRARQRGVPSPYPCEGCVRLLLFHRWKEVGLHPLFPIPSEGPAPCGLRFPVPRRRAVRDSILEDPLFPQSGWRFLDWRTEIGVSHIDIPITPPKVWKLLRESGAARTFMFQTGLYSG